MAGFRSIKKCLQASELYLAQALHAVADWMELFPRYEFAKSITTDETVARLRAGHLGLFTRPSVAFEALRRMDVLKYLRLFDRKLKPKIWQEPPLNQWLKAVEFRNHNDNMYPDKAVYTTPISILDCLIYGAIRDTSEYSTEVGYISRCATPRELEAVRSTVAEILDVVRTGADLSILDNYPMAVGIWTIKKGGDSLATLHSIELAFKDLPVRVALCHNDGRRHYALPLS
jgi:hypothetical protein